MIRLMLVEDHVSLRDALAFVLDKEPDLQIAAQAQSLAEARARIAPVDVAIVDLKLPDGIGTNLIPDLREVNPGVRVLILTGSVSRLDLALAIEAGAEGCVHKSVPIDEIIAAVRKVAMAQPIHTQQEIMEFVRIAAKQRESDRRIHDTVSQLTPREREILQTLAYGLSERDIAKTLHISEHTVRNHVVNILSKLGVHSRLQAALFAARMGIVDLNLPDSETEI